MRRIVRDYIIAALYRQELAALFEPEESLQK